jgi:phosphate uptake regulator
MFGSSLHLFVAYSDELALEIIEADISVDGQYSAARNRVFELLRANPDAAEHLVRTIDAFHALEHVADHAVEIARRMQILHRSF